MAISLKIKSQYQDTKIAFGSRSKPLKERTQEELRDLAIIAIESNNPNLTRLFEQLPTLDELKNEKVSKAIPVAAPTPTKTITDEEVKKP